jgi:hypothetical protein
VGWGRAGGSEGIPGQHNRPDSLLSNIELQATNIGINGSGVLSHSVPSALPIYPELRATDVGGKLYTSKYVEVQSPPLMHAPLSLCCL